MRRTNTVSGGVDFLIAYPGGGSSSTIFLVWCITHPHEIQHRLAPPPAGETKPTYLVPSVPSVPVFRGGTVGTVEHSGTLI